MKSEVTQSCLTLSDPMDCSLPGSSVHGIFQARVLEWVAISFSRRSSWSRDQTQVSWIVGRCFTIWATRKSFWDIRLPLIPLQRISTSRRQHVNKTYPRSLLQGSFKAHKRQKNHSNLFKQILSRTFLTPICSPVNPLSFHLLSFKYLFHSIP